MSSPYEGWISRHLNRRLSRPLAGLLSRTGVTPNQVSLASFALAIGSFFLFFFGYNILGGIVVQISAIVDGADGDLARLKNAVSKFGAFFDSLLDRYSDGAIILGMIFWATKFEAYPQVWLVGLLALGGSLMISYSRARGEAVNLSLSGGAAFLSSRDMRLFVIMVGSIVGQVYWTMVFLAVLTNAVVMWRLVSARRLLRE